MTVQDHEEQVQQPDEPASRVANKQTLGDTRNRRNRQTDLMPSTGIKAGNGGPSSGKRHNWVRSVAVMMDRLVPISRHVTEKSYQLHLVLTDSITSATELKATVGHWNRWKEEGR